MRNQQKLSVAIVGAGIGGLAVAAALRKYFIEPVIYECAPDPSPRAPDHLRHRDGDQTFPPFGRMHA
jgi:cation diffusion facilitator CzcD-associated flavoprotein CzcO